jgi:hypothetical protein
MVYFQFLYKNSYQSPYFRRVFLQTASKNPYFNAVYLRIASKKSTSTNLFCSYLLPDHSKKFIPYTFYLRIISKNSNQILTLHIFTSWPFQKSLLYTCLRDHFERQKILTLMLFTSGSLQKKITTQKPYFSHAYLRITSKNNNKIHLKSSNFISTQFTTHKNHRSVTPLAVLSCHSLGGSELKSLMMLILETWIDSLPKFEAHSLGWTPTSTFVGFCRVVFVR